MYIYKNIARDILERSIIGFKQLIHYHKYSKCADPKIYTFDKPFEVGFFQS